MRFPSIREAADKARETLLRFPLVLLAAATAAGTALVMVERSSDAEDLLHILFPALLGLPLLIAIATRGERAAWSVRARWITGSAAFVGLALYGVWSMRWSDTVLATRFVHLVIAFHLMVAILPFLGTPAQRSFWQYNRLLFLRFLTATLFSGVLFAGLAIALVAIDNLLGIDIDEEMYVRLFILLGLVFHPWYFLGGVPRDIPALEQRDDYPGGLKIFAQFILIPVVTVYLAILTAYLVRILVTRTWPSGWIGWLVSSVAAAGTLALLLVHPVRERADSRWVDVYGRWFYVVLLPSIAMLLMAIWQRVDQYGFTERRYFLAVLALWLGGIAAYYAITGSRNIRAIPATLCLVALFTFSGPWSAYSVARLSQSGRLRTLLERNEILVDGSLRPPPGDVSFEDRREISATVRYLIDTHGSASLARVQPALRDAADETRVDSFPETPDHPVARTVVARIGVEYVSRWQTPSPNVEMVNFYTNPYGTPIDVAGWDVVVRIHLLQPFQVPMGKDTLVFGMQSQPQQLTVSLRGMQVVSVPFEGLLERAREALLQPEQASPARVVGIGPTRPPLILDAEGGGFRFRFQIINLSGNLLDTGREVSAAEADVLIARFPGG
jgi:hypothetical protein